jgi:exodeoxyribonuclease V
MQLLQRLLAHLNGEADCPPGLVSFLSTYPGQDFVVRLVQLDGVLNSHVLDSILPPSPTTLCSECGEPQFDTPHGITCKNGHGGAEPRAVVELTEYQQKAEDLIKAWLTEDPVSQPFFIVKGYAGSGKTWFSGHLKSVFAAHPNKPTTIVYAAPTHKAASVASEFLDADVCTLASILNIKVSDDDEELTYTLPDTLPVFAPNTLLQIDEASMLSTQYLEFLIKVVETFGLRVLFFGDPAQLPPVGEIRSPVWKIVEDDTHQITLFDVKRYSGELLEFATEVREAVFSSVKRKNFNPFGVTARDKLKVSYSLEHTLAAHAEEFRDGATKLVAWRNREVDAAADFLRKCLGFNDEYAVGELYALRGITVDTSGTEVGFTEAEVKIEHREADKHYEYEGHRIPSLRLFVTGAFSSTIRVVEPGCESFLSEALSKMARRARGTKDRYARSAAWKSFWKMKNSFAILKSAYSLTTHRAQGSQYDHVIVNVKDILSNPTRTEAFRCLYVASTRSTNRITLVV